MSNSESFENVKIPYPTEGVIRTAQIDDTVAPSDSVQLAVNMNFDRVGAVQTRPGLASTNASDLTGAIKSFGKLGILSTFQYRLLAQAGVLGGLVSAWDGTLNWTLVRVLSNSVINLITSYSESYQDNYFEAYSGHVTSYGQSFRNPSDIHLSSCKFYLRKDGTPTGNITASIYLATGSLGTTSKPTGAALATSNPIDITTLTGSFSLKEFTFPLPVLLSALTDYVITVNYSGGSSGNELEVGYDASSSTFTGNVSYFDSGFTWTAVSGTDLCFYIYGQVEAISSKARFAQFLNLTWMVNGANGDPVATYDGVTFGTTQVPASFPKGDYIQAGFEGRVWVANKGEDIVYYTDIVQFTPPSTYVLTFDAATNFIKNFSPQNGESITGLFVVPRALLIFKQNHIYRVYGASSVDAYPAYNVGTYSQESIVQTKDGVYFHHSSGFYKFAYDSEPVEISRRVIDFVRAISRTNYENITGVYDGFDNIEWAVGSVVVEGVTYSNCVMRYTISTQVWTIYDYMGGAITAMIRYDNGTTIDSYVGNASGKLGLMGSGNTDFLQLFYYELIDRWRSFTELYAKTKRLMGINVYSENAAGANLFFQKQKDLTNKWDALDTVDENNMSLFPNANTEDFEVGRLRIAGTTKGAQVVIHGIEILKIQDDGFDRN